MGCLGIFFFALRMGFCALERTLADREGANGYPKTLLNRSATDSVLGSVGQQHGQRAAKVLLL
jgi:hypothetical protein